MGTNWRANEALEDRLLKAAFKPAADKPRNDLYARASAFYFALFSFHLSLVTFPTPLSR